MGIKERRLREIEAVKAAIMKSSRAIAQAKGWPEVSIRKIAKAIEYTPPVIYEHFKNREAILIAWEDQGFRELRYVLEEARSSEKEPHAQLHAQTAALWDWAFSNRELYEIMFNLEGAKCSPANPKALWDCAGSVRKTLTHIRIFSAEQESLFFNWWALVHGHISLVMSGQMPGMMTTMRRYLLDATARFAKAL